MDLPSLNALLRVNGLTKDSSPENISDVLLRSGYVEGEIPEALAILKGAPPSAKTRPAEYIEPAVAHARVTQYQVVTSIFARRIGARQFWLGTIIAFALYALIFLIIEVSAVPIFSLISGISLFSPPDLATAPVRSVLLFGIGMAMLILPALFFLTVSVGLQVRRCHDYGLSAPAWFMTVAALTVGAYLLERLTPLASFSILGAFVLWIVLMSWPGSKEPNEYGSPLSHPSLWGALYGSCNESGCLNAFVRKFLMPLVYLEATGIVLSIFIHTIIPRAHIPRAIQ